MEQISGVIGWGPCGISGAVGLVVGSVVPENTLCRWRAITAAATCEPSDCENWGVAVRLRRMWRTMEVMSESSPFDNFLQNRYQVARRRRRRRADLYRHRLRGKCSIWKLYPDQERISRLVGRLLCDQKHLVGQRSRTRSDDRDVGFFCQQNYPSINGSCHWR